MKKLFFPALLLIVLATTGSTCKKEEPQVAAPVNAATEPSADPANTPPPAPEAAPNSAPAEQNNGGEEAGMGETGSVHEDGTTAED